LLTTTGETRPAPIPGVRQFARRGPAKLFFAPGLAPAAAEWIAGGGAVVHGHGLYVYPNAAVGRLARRHASPLVYHPHGMFEPWILARSRFKKRVAHVLFEDANFRHARLWRALTAREADQIRARGITAPVVVIPNGIDPGPPPEPRTTAGRSRRQVLFLGRLHPKKGLALLVEAWSHLARQSVDWEVVIAGPDELGHRAEIEALVRAAGLENSFRFLGPVVGEAKRACLLAADVFILPSHSEGFSVAILEAMAAGLPVVATTACNFPELAAAGAGWECAPTAAGVTSALALALAAGDVERQQRGALARALVGARYAWPGLAAALHTECLRLV
jgi:glycosyltransferase involved in cell wall biosynthesis